MSVVVRSTWVGGGCGGRANGGDGGVGRGDSGVGGFDGIPLRWLW